MKNWPIGKRIAVTSALFLAIGAVIGLVGLFSLARVGRSLTGVATESLPGVEKLASMQAIALELRGTSFLMGSPGLTSDYRSKQMVHVNELDQQALEVLQAYGSSVSEKERPLFEQLSTDTRSFLDVCRRYREMSLQGKVVEAGQYWSKEGGSRSKAFRASVQKALDADKAGVRGFVTEAESAATFSRILTWSLLLISLVGGSLYAYIVVRNISHILARSAGAIRDSVEQVVSSSTQVASASETLAQGASDQAASLETTSASSHQVSAMTRRNSENSMAAATLMLSVDEQIAQANTKLTHLENSMERISDSSHRIAKIIKMIDEIAFQTNILALNAAVEAARAGQEGLGFGVVAEEVRNLARRSTQAAQDITALIDESVNNADAGNQRLSEVSFAIGAITENATKVKTLIESVSQSAAEQSTGVEYISKSLVQMEQITQQTAAGAEESASASHQMKAQAESLHTVVLELEALAAS